MIVSWLGRLLVAIVPVLLVVGSARAEEPSGVLWETTSQTVVEGMPMAMPAVTSKLCTAKEWTQPPPGGDKTCVATDFQKVGNKATWKMQCSGEMPMTGTGELNFVGTDSYTGQIKAAAEGMPMTIKLSGKKIGTCDEPAS
jgi:hypothetical protein